MGRLARILALTALAPFLSGAHCNEDCGPPKTSLASRPIERTVYGPALVAAEQVTLLGEALSPFDRRAIRVDASRPVAVLLTTSRAWGGVARLDGSKLRAGDHGPGFTVVGSLDAPGKLPLFDGPGALDEAKREGWDAIVLMPRTPGDAPWQVAVAIEMGRTVKPVKDDKGTCVERGGPHGPPPSFTLASLPLRCGDGARQDDEDCDDGNRRSGDGCSAFCKRER